MSKRHDSPDWGGLGATLVRWVRRMVDRTNSATHLGVRMPIQFREDKATQVAARFLDLGGGRMNFMKLVKLIYLADRHALVGWGRPITMDVFCSLRNGPIVSNVLNLMNEQPNPEERRYWHRFVSERKTNYEVDLLEKPKRDQLSRAEEEAVDRVWREHGHRDQWALVEWTHGLPEWRNPGNSMLPIRLRDILVPAGYSEAEVSEIEEDLDYFAQLDHELQR